MVFCFYKHHTRINMKTAIKRIEYLDFLRTISIFSVIMIHVTATGLSGELWGGLNKERYWRIR